MSRFEWLLRAYGGTTFTLGAILGVTHWIVLQELWIDWPIYHNLADTLLFLSSLAILDLTSMLFLVRLGRRGAKSWRSA